MKINLPKEVFEFILKEVNHLIESGDAKEHVFSTARNNYCSFSNIKTNYEIGIEEGVLSFNVRQKGIKVRFTFYLSWVEQLIKKLFMINHKEVEVTITHNEDKVFGSLSTTVNYHFTEEQFNILSPKLYQLAKTIKEGVRIKEREKLNSAVQEQIEKIKEVLNDKT